MNTSRNLILRLDWVSGFISAVKRDMTKSNCYDVQFRQPNYSLRFE
jgi:hypothetical protein